jgi:hypothetical protein
LFYRTEYVYIVTVTGGKKISREDIVAVPLQQWLGGSVTTSRDTHVTFLVTSDISATYFGFEQRSADGPLKCMCVYVCVVCVCGV